MMTRLQWTGAVALSVAIAAAGWVPPSWLPGGRTRPVPSVGTATVASPMVSGGNEPDVPTGPRVPHPPPKPGEVRELSIKQLGNFEYRPGELIPADVQRLNGMKVRLSGFMLITKQAKNIREFALVPNLFSCCYGQPPTIQHVVMVNTPDGKFANYSFDRVVVEGTLTVKETKEDGYVTSLFQVAATKLADESRSPK
jgi:hypothetical protein